MDDETAKILEEAIHAALEEGRGGRFEWRYWLALMVPVLTGAGVVILEVALRQR